MHATAKALLDAHTRHVMQQLTGPALAGLLDDETAVAWEWLAARPVTAIIDEVRVRDFLLRNVFDINPHPRLLEQIGSIATRAIKSPLNKQTRLEELLNVREYDLIVDRLIALEEVRREIVHAVLQNPSVSQLISDLVYNGVKNYLAENSGLAKKVPGASSLMKMGKGLMERVGADDAIEGALKSYVQRNTRATMEMSEKLVTHALETPKLKAISRQFWQQVKGAPLERVTRYVEPDDVQDVVEIGSTLWNHFRQTSYSRELLNELVHAWFEERGNEPATSVLESIGLDKTRLQGEVRHILLPLAVELEKGGHLEARVRQHLSVFYASAEATAALGG
ncbi:MAG: hypothetical protein REI12_03990 [Pedobacter sp.]|nr:hypothetical protein [Pedobacter sp.]